MAFNEFIKILNNNDIKIIIEKINNDLKKIII